SRRDHRDFARRCASATPRREAVANSRCCSTGGAGIMTAPDLQGLVRKHGGYDKISPRPGPSTTAPWRGGKSAERAGREVVHLRKFRIRIAQTARRSASAAFPASIGGRARLADGRSGGVKNTAIAGRTTPTTARRRTTLGVPRGKRGERRQSIVLAYVTATG